MRQATKERNARPQTNLQQTKEELHDTVLRLSRDIVDMTTKAGSGHPSTSLSAIDTLAGLYFGGVLRHKPSNPTWPGRDRFILSKGHGAPALYAVLAAAGYFEEELLPTLRTIGSPVEGHPNMRRLPGVEASTGSLGQGLSIGLGHALASRLDDQDYRVYVMIGDGESDEGQIWEAAMGAAKYKTDNLTAILDYNKFQQTGASHDIMPSLEPIGEKWRAFGWDVQEIDGHDMGQILDAFHTAIAVTGQPQMIIANTLKGRGLSPFEEDKVSHKHGKALDAEERTTALNELDADQPVRGERA